MKVTKSQLKELIRHTIVDLTEKTFGSKAQYDAYRKKHNLKPGSKHKVAGKTVTVRDTKKMSKKAKSLGDKMADKLNKRMADLEKKRKQGKIKESKKRRYTVKEVRMWMKKLEENRYKKVYNSDARRVAWMVNNEGVSLDEMPMSMKKKWSKAQYGRERYLATEFLKSKSEQLSEGLDLKKLETAIKDFQKKIKKQGRVTNARDEDHLEQLIKVYKQMGGKKIKEQMNESKLRGVIREIIKEQLNEGKLQTQFEIPTREQRKVMTVLRKAKYKEGKDYDFGVAKGPKFVLEVPKKLENKILSLLIQKNVRNIHEI